MSPQKNIADHISRESQRLERSVKEMLASERLPTDAEKDALLSDMEQTLAELTAALEMLSSSLNIPVAAKEEEDSVA